MTEFLKKAKCDDPEYDTLSEDDVDFENITKKNKKKTKRDRICKLCERYQCNSELQAQKDDGYEHYGEFGHGSLAYKKNRNLSGGKQNRKTKSKSKSKSKRIRKRKRKITIRKKKKKTYKYKKRAKKSIVSVPFD